MKVIFLDIDGVLNNDAHWKRIRGKRKYYTQVSQTLLDKLLIITKETGANLIISSSWRGFQLKETIEDFETCKSKNELKQITKYIVGITPHSNERHRGKEIKWFIENQDDCLYYKLVDQKLDIDDYVIIDDDADMLDEQKPHFFQTKYWRGLTMWEVKKIINYFNR